MLSPSPGGRRWPEDRRRSIQRRRSLPGPGCARRGSIRAPGLESAFALAVAARAPRNRRGGEAGSARAARRQPAPTPTGTRRAVAEAAARSSSPCPVTLRGPRCVVRRFLHHYHRSWIGALEAECGRLLLDRMQRRQAIELVLQDLVCVLDFLS